MKNPLLSIDWLTVRMMIFEDEKTITIREEGKEVQRFKFDSAEDRDAAFKEWVERGNRISN